MLYPFLAPCKLIKINLIQNITIYFYVNIFQFQLIKFRHPLKNSKHIKNKHGKNPPSKA